VVFVFEAPGYLPTSMKLLCPVSVTRTDRPGTMASKISTRLPGFAGLSDLMIRSLRVRFAIFSSGAGHHGDTGYARLRTVPYGVGWYTYGGAQARKNGTLINWDELIWLGMLPRDDSLLISRSLVRSQPGSPSRCKRRKTIPCRGRVDTIPSSCDSAPPFSRHRIKTARSACDILVRQGLLCRGGNHANDRSCVTRAGRNVFDQHRRRCRVLVRELPTGCLKLRLFLVRAMLGHGSRPGGILRAESIPRDSLWDGRRRLGHPQHAEALSARLLEK